MATASLQSNQDYGRMEQAIEERVAMRNVALQQRAREEREREPGPKERKEAKQVRLWAYVGPFMVAGFKDTLDLVLVGSFPGIGTAVTICCYLCIFFLFLIKSDLTVRMKPVFLFQAGGALMFATGVEGFAFGLNFLPVGLGIIFGIYFREKRYALSSGVLGRTLTLHT